jgi:iron complex outermembrane receptor protein
MKQILPSLLFLLFSTFIFAQDSLTVGGIVRDENKQPMPGATVLLKGTTLGTTTDNDGKYSLRIPKSGQTLVISYVGYEAQEMPINTSKGDYTLNVDMGSGAISLNQVVVSVSKRKEKLIDAPASITVIGQAQLMQNVVTTPVDELKGTAGVDMIRTGLISSDVVIRGFNDIFSGSVLNVIDNRIGSVPSLQVNAYQLVSTSVSIITKDPLEQEKKFETTVAMTSGFTVLDNMYKQYNSGSKISGNIVNPEIRHSGKLLDGKIGYKISAGYFQGQDYPNYDPREPNTGDSLIFGSVKNGQVFQPDTIGYNVKYNPTTRKNDTTAQLDVRQFNKNFFIRKYNADGRLEFRPIKDLTITLNGGMVSSHNVELTGLGAGVAGGDNGGWIYWYTQAMVKWKNLFVQYYIDASNSGSTYLIPQVSGSTPPYNVQLLEDKSVLHVVQIQHSWSPIEKLNFVYGGDIQLTRPNTGGTIDGRYEDSSKLDIYGLYLQGDYSPLKWLKIVAATRVDYNSVIKNVAVSPRGALVFKPAENQDIRLTYNRAYSSPTTLDQFLDLANGEIPNGINVRGIGNPNGWNYMYAPDGTIEFKTAPYGGGYNSGTWVPYNSNAANVPMLDSLKQYMVNLFSAKGSPLYGQNAIATALINELFNGISGPNGTVANATKMSINYANFAETGNLPSSIQNVDMFHNLKKIDNQYTQTAEIGYKGLLFHKLSIEVDGYYTRLNNYVPGLLSASGAVLLNYQSYLGKLNANGTPDTNGLLYKNLYANGGFLNNQLAPVLDAQASLHNTSIVPTTPGSAWSELVVLTNKFPIGTITPNSPYVGSDYILTYENIGTINIFGLDLGLQYAIYETNLHKFSMGGNFSWVDKNDVVVAPGDTAWLNAPKFKAGLQADYMQKKIGFGAGISWRMQSGYFAESSIYSGQVLPIYDMLDARVSYRMPFYKGLLLSINVNNLRNHQWSSFSMPGIPLMGTQFYVRAQITF